MNREKKLAKNIIIYMLGNISSKILAFIMLPIYTYFLSQSDMGIFDIIYNTGLIAIPIFTICSYTSIFRFSIDESDIDKRNVIISNGVFIIIIGIFIATIPYIVYSMIVKFNNSGLILLLIITMTLVTVWQQIARAIERNVVFAISGLLLTFITILTSILFITVLKMKLEGLILSYVVSYISAFIYVEWKLAIINKFKVKYVNKDSLKKMIAYSLPLLPSEISWWLVSGVNRYFIIFFLGLEANGVFSVASKFPALLTMINGIFNLAWTESSILEYKSEDKDEYYTKMFNLFMRLQFTVFIILLPVLKYLMEFMLHSTYNSSWIYMPMLLLGTIFASFSSFYGTGYLSSKKTSGAFSSILTAAVVNISLTCLLIPWIGLQGAGIATCASFICLWLFRVTHTRKFFAIRIEYKTLFLYIGLVILYVCGVFLDILWIDIILFVFAIIIGYMMNREFIKSIFRVIYQKYLSKFRHTSGQV